MPIDTRRLSDGPCINRYLSRCPSIQGGMPSVGRQGGRGGKGEHERKRERKGRKNEKKKAEKKRKKRQKKRKKTEARRKKEKERKKKQERRNKKEEERRRKMRSFKTLYIHKLPIDRLTRLLC